MERVYNNKKAVGVERKGREREVDKGHRAGKERVGKRTEGRAESGGWGK